MGKREGKGEGDAGWGSTFLWPLTTPGVKRRAAAPSARPVATSCEAAPAMSLFVGWKLVGAAMLSRGLGGVC